MSTPISWLIRWVPLPRSWNSPPPGGRKLLSYEHKHPLCSCRFNSEQRQLSGPPAARLKGMTSWQYLFSSKKSYLFIRKSVNQRQLRQNNQRTWEENPKKNFFLEDDPCQSPGNPVAAPMTVLKSSLSKRKRTTRFQNNGVVMILTFSTWISGW